MANNDGIRHQTEKTMLFLAGIIQYFVVSMICCFWRGSYNFLFVWGFSNKRESCTYDSVYYLRRDKTTKNTLNIMLFGEDVLVPLYGCMLSFVEIQLWSYFQNNMAMFVFYITLCTTGYVER